MCNIRKEHIMKVSFTALIKGVSQWEHTTMRPRLANEQRYNSLGDKKV